MDTKNSKVIRISFGRKSYKLSMTKKFRLVFGAGLLTLLILTGGFLVYLHSVNAGSAILYPGSCLGSWQNPDKAQGQPEAQGSQFINKENSAVFSEGGIKEIYCGSFNGNFSESEIKLIKSVNLKFSWLVSDEELKIATSSIIIIQPSATSSEAVTQNANYIINQILNNVHADEVKVIFSTTTPEITIVTNIASPEIATMSDVVKIATSSPTSFWWRKYNFFFAEDTISNKQQTTGNTQQTTTIATTTTIFTSTATSSLDSLLAPTEDFLKVSYTLDGINWQALGMVNKNNWQNTGFQIPVYRLEDIKKIQIKIESLPLVNKTPYVYLDGMTLEVEYESGTLAKQDKSLTPNEQSPPVSSAAVSNRALGESALASQVNISVRANNFPDLTQAPNHWADDCLPNTPDHWRIMAVDSHNNYYLGPEYSIDKTSPIDASYNFSLPKSDYVKAAVIWGVGTFDQTNKCGMRWLEWHFMKATQFLQIMIQINAVHP